MEKSSKVRNPFLKYFFMNLTWGVVRLFVLLYVWEWVGGGRQPMDTSTSLRQSAPLSVSSIPAAGTDLRFGTKPLKIFALRPHH